MIQPLPTPHDAADLNFSPSALNKVVLLPLLLPLFLLACRSLFVTSSCVSTSALYKRQVDCTFQYPTSYYTPLSA